MTTARPIPKYLGLVVLGAMMVFAVVGYFSIRNDVAQLRKISQDNLLWSASQIEIELVRFGLSVARMEVEGTDESLAEVKERFDILWSRVGVMSDGRVGEILQSFDTDFGAIDDMRSHLEALDPTIETLKPGDTETARIVRNDIGRLQSKLRFFTLRVVRADAESSAYLRDRIETSSQITAATSLGAVLLSILSLLLIFQENRRQRQIAELNLKAAEEAEMASRAKSRFLTMISHELRNPLNGVVGPLALLKQSGLSDRQHRLVERATHSGESMVQMVAGLLDYGEIQDGGFKLSAAPFRASALAESIRGSLAGSGVEALEVRIGPCVPDVLNGDMDRLRQIYVNLLHYVLESRHPTAVTLDFDYERDCLVGQIGLAKPDDAVEARLNLLMGLNEIAPDQVSTEALRPLLSRGLIGAAQGAIRLVRNPAGGRDIQVSIPAVSIGIASISIHMETRSSALAAIYEAALRSDPVVFHRPDSGAPVDVVLVDATTVASDALMVDLRERFPRAAFISLGHPNSPRFFDDIVDTPNDMGRLRSSILSRLAS